MQKIRCDLLGEVVLSRNFLDPRKVNISYLHDNGNILTISAKRDSDPYEINEALDDIRRLVSGLA